MNKRTLTITVHIAIWTCFFLLPFVLSPRPSDPKFQLSAPTIWMYVCIDIFLISFYYFNTQVLIPRLLFAKKWFWYILTIIVCLILFTQIPEVFEDAIRRELPQNRKWGFKKWTIFPYPFRGTSAVFLLVLTVSTCIRVVQQWFAAEQKQKEIALEKSYTELSFLKSQINPHFLFNTLNNIYSLAVVKSDATAPAVMKLSSIMRYVLNDTKQHWVPLEKELLFIQHYIDLQKVRLTDKVAIHFTVTGEVEDSQIAPLIFIPFVENAFKYGISAKEQSDISISINVDSTSITLTVDNRVVSIENKDDNTGIGLNNTRRRLELLYPDKHQLEIKHENQHFHVYLKLSR